jgi:uncharacterized RDD family membrane protein YckC
MIVFAVAGIGLPAQIWGTLALSKEPTPFQSMAFAPRIEVIIVVVLAIIALVTAYSMWRKQRRAIGSAILYFSISWAHGLVESILTYGTKKPFPGPRIACITEPILGLGVFCIMGWYFLAQYPKVIKDA